MASLLLVCSLGAFATPAFAETHQLELKFQCRAIPEATELRVTLRNIGSIDTAVVLGTSIGNGRKYVADLLALEVKRGETGAVERYQPDRGFIAGRIDPWIVPLPSGSEFSFTIPVNNFYAPGRGRFTLGKADADVRLSLARDPADKSGGEMVGAALVSVFVGELKTDWIRMPGGCATG